MKIREVTRTARGMPTSDGAGVKLTRIIGTPDLDHVDPFLLLDEFRSDRPDDYIAGFPEHPHRGFETVTYLLHGAMEHRDHTGRHGVLESGAVQWMTAGRGIVHSEMPRQRQGLLWGFQLWVNLPARDKMREPRYQEFPAAAIPTAALPGGGTARVIAGRTAGIEGAVSGIATAPLYLDVHLPAGATLTQEVAAGHNAFSYVYEGAVDLGGGALGAGILALLGDGDAVAAAGPGRFLLIAARPLGEPVARRGPFVMNTEAEIAQALRDLRQGTFV